MNTALLPLNQPLNQTDRPITLAAPNYAALMQVRAQLLANHQDMPNYLLMPEVEQLIAAAATPAARLLLRFLWLTGARLNEALDVRRTDLMWHPASLNTPAYVEVTLRTLKQRQGNASKPLRGRPRKRNGTDSQPIRSVAIFDYPFMQELSDHIEVTKRWFRGKAARAAKKTDTAIASDKIFINPETLKSWSPAQVRNWTYDAAARLDSQGQGLGIDVNPHIFRHSFAVHLVLHHTDITTISALLGHKSLRSTVIYLNVWRAEKYVALAGIPFRSA